MINYTIHYVKGESPEERMKAMLTAGSMERPGEIGRLMNERGVNVLTRVLTKTVESLNTLLQDVPNIPKLKYWSHRGTTIWFNSISGLLNIIIPQLEELEAFIRPAKKINQEIIAELKKLKTVEGISPTQVMKILVQFEVPGVKQIEFKNNNEEINLERLLDINYPTDLVPNDYNCGVLMTIMSDPCKATTTEAVDRSVVLNTRLNPFTRQPWPEAVETDEVLSQEIGLFIKKVEWLYYAFNDNERYKHLYHDETISSWLQDKHLSYELFCEQVNLHMANMSNTTNFVFFNPVKEDRALPAKYILDLFAKHQIHTLRPSAEEYEKLIRRMAVAGDDHGLSQLLSSPILDVIKIDIYAKNDKGQNVIDLLNQYRDQYPRLAENYALCQAHLKNYKTPPAADQNSGCTIS